MANEEELRQQLERQQQSLRRLDLTRKGMRGLLQRKESEKQISSTQEQLNQLEQERISKEREVEYSRYKQQVIKRALEKGGYALADPDLTPEERKQIANVIASRQQLGAFNKGVGEFIKKEGVGTSETGNIILKSGEMLNPKTLQIIAPTGNEVKTDLVRTIEGKSAYTPIPPQPTKVQEAVTELLERGPIEKRISSITESTRNIVKRIIGSASDVPSFPLGITPSKTVELVGSTIEGTAQGGTALYRLVTNKDLSEKYYSGGNTFSNVLERTKVAIPIIATVSLFFGAVGAGRIIPKGIGLTAKEIQKLQTLSADSPEFFAIRARAIRSIERNYPEEIARQKILELNRLTGSRIPTGYIAEQRAVATLRQERLKVSPEGFARPSTISSVATSTKVIPQREINILARDGLVKTGVARDIKEAKQMLKESSLFIEETPIGPSKQLFLREGALGDIQRNVKLKPISTRPDIEEKTLKQISIGNVLSKGEGTVGFRITGTLTDKGKIINKNLEVMQIPKGSKVGLIRTFEAGKASTKNIKIADSSYPITFKQELPIRETGQYIFKVKRLQSNVIGETPIGQNIETLSKVQIRKNKFFEPIRSDVVEAGKRVGEGTTKEINAFLFKKSFPTKEGIIKSTEIPITKKQFGFDELEQFNDVIAKNVIEGDITESIIGYSGSGQLKTTLKIPKKIISPKPKVLRSGIETGKLEQIQVLETSLKQIPIVSKPTISIPKNPKVAVIEKATVGVTSIVSPTIATAGKVNERVVTLEADKLNSVEKSSQIQLVKEKESVKEKTRTTSINFQPSKLTPIEITLPKQPQKERTGQFQPPAVILRPANPQEPIIKSPPIQPTIFKPPRSRFIVKPIPENVPNKAKLITDLIQAYKVITFKGGKPITIAKGLTKGRALKRGTEEVLKSLRASFKIEPEGKTADRDINFKVPEQLFRRGKYNQDRFVQRKGGKEGGFGRLASFGERLEIKRAKKQRGWFK